MAGLFLRKILPLGVAIIFLNLAPVLAQEDLSPPTNVSLKYEKIRPGEKTVCSGVGLLAAMDCVTIRMEGAGQDGNITSTAALSVTLTPVLRAEGTYREVKVYVRVEAGSPSISTNFENQQQVEADVNSDARLVNERLKRWNKSLTYGQLYELKTKGETQVKISNTFWSVLKLLKPENPPVTLTLRMPPFEMDMKFLVKDGDGYSHAPPSGVGYGEVFVVEVTFTQPQSEPTFYVDLNWEGAFMKYEARLVRADNTGKLYRSDELRAKYLNEPGVERAVDPGGP
ncbi:MAG: hypothetical protein IIA70_03015 [Proteobacteria bacterium]|nr:hypothetical protein [Pseudomonadota bacterium]